MAAEKLCFALETQLAVSADTARRCKHVSTDDNDSGLTGYFLQHSSILRSEPGVGPPTWLSREALHAIITKQIPVAKATVTHDFGRHA